MAIIWTKLIPRWGGDTIEPPEAKKDTGYIAGDKPPAKWENWLRKGTYEALDETRDVIEGIDSQLAQIELDVIDLLENKSIHSSGSNANGRWIRFQDGTQICSFTQKTTGLSVAANTNNSGFLSFPSPFLEQPIVTGNVLFVDSDGNSLQSLLNLVSRSIAGSVSTYRFVCVHNGVNEFGFTGRTGTQRVIDMVAIGGWK